MTKDKQIQDENDKRITQVKENKVKQHDDIVTRKKSTYIKSNKKINTPKVPTTNKLPFMFTHKAEQP